MIPILMITYNRLEYTKKAFEALLQVNGAYPIIIDNGSKDGTTQWLHDLPLHIGYVDLVFNLHNKGIAYAMNQFLDKTKKHEIVGKVDCDTIVPRGFVVNMLPHMEKADIVQAKHKLIEASQVGTFDQWVSKMPSITPTLKQNHFVGGSGILWKRQLVSHIPETEWKLGGWRQFQREHPELKKAFATDVEIELLDSHGYSDYPEYYKSTGRV